MIWRTTAQQEAFLLTQRESGMGYQIVEFVEPRATRTTKAVVYQALLVVALDDEFDLELSFLSNRKDWDSWVKEPDSFDFLRDVRALRVITPPSAGPLHLVAEPLQGRCDRRSGGCGAMDAPILEADGSSHYVRVSAFSNDRRVDLLHRCLLPGTFATTVKDYLACVRCPDDPVDRYALPHGLPITTAFHIRPMGSDRLQIGLVQPNFGHEGGGEEVFFSKGTSHGTMLDIRPYGHEAHG